MFFVDLEMQILLQKIHLFQSSNHLYEFPKQFFQKIYLFANYSGNQIELKWFLKNYESNYIFKIYRAKKGEKPKLIATIKPSSLSQLKRAGYDKDYIFMIYPFKDAKNINQQISILKIQPKVSVFRILRAIQENSFAKNLGHYFIDKMIKKTLCTYTRQQLIKTAKKQ